MSEWEENSLLGQNHSGQDADSNGDGEPIGPSEVEDLEARLMELVKLVEISEDEIRKRRSFRHCLEEVLVEHFPSVEIHPFGSTACGLGLARSDLDLHVELNTSCSAKSLDRKEKTKALAEALWAHKRFRNALPILDCRTPIVQLWDKETGIKCDLSVCSSMGVLNTKFVKFCLDSDPRARMLAMVIKCFAKKHHITGSGLGDHVTSYCLVLMVIFFLQIQGILHTLTTLQSVPGLKEVLVNDFNFSFCTDSSKLPPLPTGKSSNFVVVELLHGFFKFFADFDYNGNSICLKQGRPAARFNMGFTSALVVEDPFEEGRNVALSVSRQRLANMVATFTTGRLLDSVPEIGSASAFVSLFRPGFPSFPVRCPPLPSTRVHKVVIQPAGSEKSG